ncbi:hypothetical protein GQ53DRAFT_834692 [Thozetella sp. PMI_491]|nr:hypothetical protein GQ53DRAFT_834692 [Thozetella sp. PMI_491]
MPDANAMRGCTPGADTGTGTSDGGDTGCSGEECDCEATKTVTARGVLCTETVELTTTITCKCSATTCVTTNRGVDWTIYALFYDNTDGVDYFVNTWIYDQDTDTRTRLNLDEPFPNEVVGPFKVKKFSLSNCEYLPATLTLAGIMVCDGDTQIMEKFYYALNQQLGL